MATPQPAIFAQGTRAHRHLEFDLRPTASPDQVLAVLRGLRQPSAMAGGVNIVVGFSPSCWRSLTHHAAPDALVEFPVIPGCPSTQHDVWVWLHSGGHDELFDVALAIARMLAPVATVAHEVDGFVYHDSRDLIGFEDGTENPGVEEAFEVAVVPDGPGRGGSFAITQRWVHDLEAFHALAVDEQERVVGRTKADSVELDDDAQPADSHVSRMVVEGDDGDELAIYRRSVPYGTVAEHGLHFVAFSADPSRFTVMLERMFGVGDGVHDRLIEFSTPVTGAYWWVPSLDALGDALG